MTPRQKIEVRLSEVRTRLNEIAGLEGDAFNDEIRSELGTLKTEYTDLESRHQAAILSEGEVEARARGAFGPDNGDGEAAEVRELFSKVNLSDYLGVAAAGGEIRSAPAELNAALKVPATGANGGVALPWDMLEIRMAQPAAGATEARAFTTTSQNDGSLMQRPVLQRLFGPGVMDMLGVRMDSVPVGRTEWPLFATGTSPAQAKEGTAAAAAVAATFQFANLKPKRLTSVYEYSHEAGASVAALEQTLRRDLADSVKAKMSDLIINGVAPTNANPQHVEGFIAKLTGVDDTAIADAARYGRFHAEAVDGIHATMETEVMSVVGDETYRHAAGTYLTGSAVSGTELLRTRSAGCMGSSYIPDAQGNIQQAILHAAGPNGGGIMRGDSVAAVWPVLEIIRDIYTQASQGVMLTWVTLWDAEVAFREDAYKLRGIQLA